MAERRSVAAVTRVRFPSGTPRKITSKRGADTRIERIEKEYNLIEDKTALKETKHMTNDKKIEWLLRVGVAGEFIGHGLLAIGGKKDWVGWISQMTQVGNDTAATLLLLIGVADVIIAIIVLVKPIRPVLLWAALWGFWTALVRPLVGQSVLDFIERSANWAAPLALYYFYQTKRDK